MKSSIGGLMVLAIAALSACTTVPSVGPQAPHADVTPVGTFASGQAPKVGVHEETEVRAVVEGFGKKLQDVSLQAPDAAEAMQKQYSEFVAPALLAQWMSDVTKAPGRIVSSPWPDRIEITTMEKDGADRYSISGFIIEVTSVEMVNGGASAEIPVQLTVERQKERWLITTYLVHK